MLGSGWRACFAERILERGEKYWRDGRVTELCRRGDTITATVLGRDDYDVEVELADGELAAVGCTCPYAEDGNGCKHEAAVLFALEAGDVPERAAGKQTGCSWREALEQMSEQELRSMVAELAAGDRQLQERIVLRRARELPAGQYKKWERTLKRLAQAADDGEGYISYVRAYDFCLSVEDFLTDTAEDLLAAGLYVDAFHLACMVYDFIQVVDMDDSDGSMSEICGLCEGVWSSLIPCADAEGKRRMYKMLAGMLPDDHGFAEDVLFDGDWDPEQQRDSLKLLDDLIEKGGLKWETGGYIERRRHLMERMGAGREEIQAFIDQHRCHPAARQMEIRDCVACGDEKRAIVLLKESKKLDRGDSTLVMEYSEQLAELYRKTGQRALYEQELRFLVLRCPNRNIEYVKRLKELTTEEKWPALFEVILMLSTMRENIPALLAWDGQFQRLHDLLLQGAWLGALDRYEAVLRSWSPEKMRDLYRRCLEETMDRAAGRNDYRKCVNYLQKLRSYPAGEETIRALVTGWRGTYPRRRAMLEELAKAGY